MLPQSIQIKFNQQIDPATINGIVGDPRGLRRRRDLRQRQQPADQFINLAGLLSFNSATDILTINPRGSSPAAATANDEYRLILKGTGSAVIRDTDGLALDGLNLDANGNQLPLPSGADHFPGSDFQVTFTIDTHPPVDRRRDVQARPGQRLQRRPEHHQRHLPTFVGTITDVFPPANPLQGQTVHIDVSTKGNGVFDLIDAGVGTTDANGNFSITLTKPIPDTPNTVGTDGIQGDPGATYAEVRVRIVDQAGNVSNLPTDPVSDLPGRRAPLTDFQVDTSSPTSPRSARWPTPSPRSTPAARSSSR